MDYYNVERLMEMLEDERERSEKLDMRIDTLEEEVSYLRPMVRYLVKHISVKVNLDELCTVEKIKEDLAYFEEKNYDIEERRAYGPKDHFNYGPVGREL